MREAAIRATAVGKIEVVAELVDNRIDVPIPEQIVTADDGFADAIVQETTAASVETSEPKLQSDIHPEATTSVRLAKAAASKLASSPAVTAPLVPKADPVPPIAAGQNHDVETTPATEQQPKVLAHVDAAKSSASVVPSTPVTVTPEVEPTTRTDDKTESAKQEREVFVITLVGDTGLNAHSQRVRPDKAVRHGKSYNWSWVTRHVAPLIDGHLNFANIETVVTTRNTLSPSSKLFNFRMHPNAARHLVDAGFNLFSLSNNHAADYGRAGILDTLKHADELKFAGLRAYAGLGRDRDGALATKTFSIGRARFGFAAMGIGAAAPGVSRAGLNKPGQGNIYRDPDFGDTVDGLAAAKVDYRIFSMHFGTERNVFPSGAQIRKWRDEVLVDRDIDLIVGHHAHVAQGVQMTDGKLIFYGLGNFLHLGTADMSRFNRCRDYGMLARIFVVREPDGSMTAQAVQIVPLTGMHLQPKPMTGKTAKRRIDILNALATKLDDEATGSRGVRFTKQVDGSGLYCAPGAENGPGRLGAVCQDHTPARPFTSSERRRLLRMCGAAPRVSAKSSKRKRRRASKRRRKEWRGQGAFRN